MSWTISAINASTQQVGTTNPDGPPGLRVGVTPTLYTFTDEGSFVISEPAVNTYTDWQDAISFTVDGTAIKAGLAHFKFMIKGGFVPVAPSGNRDRVSVEYRLTKNRGGTLTSTYAIPIYLRNSLESGTIHPFSALSFDAVFIDNVQMSDIVSCQIRYWIQQSLEGRFLHFGPGSLRVAGYVL